MASYSIWLGEVFGLTSVWILWFDICCIRLVISSFMSARIPWFCIETSLPYPAMIRIEPLHFTVFLKWCHPQICLMDAITFSLTRKLKDNCFPNTKEQIFQEVLPMIICMGSGWISWKIQPKILLQYLVSYQPEYWKKYTSHSRS